ncbi:MAG TPA: homoserine kinase [Candidatus Sumerlaeota bacterium]|nr:homoserine kinase [Candidatus Sumerlaeota bacterium]
MAATGDLIIRVPASTSNLGPGYDCLGLALNLYNDFTVQVNRRPGARSTVTGRGRCAGIPAEDNPFVRAYAAVGEMAGADLPAVSVTVDGDVPLGVGLGSSAGGAVAGALAANALLGLPFTYEELIEPLVRVEGHPDNVTPSLLGGLTVSTATDAGPLTHVYQVAEAWRLAFLIPDYVVETTAARGALPSRVPLADAAFNLSRVPFVIHALVAGDGEMLGRVMEDRLHEPVRGKMIKRDKRIRRAARAAGACATFISGSGPAIGAFCLGQETAERVAEAMRAETEGAKFTAEALVLRPKRGGARIAEGDQP